MNPVRVNAFTRHVAEATKGLARYSNMYLFKMHKRVYKFAGSRPVGSQIESYKSPGTQDLTAGGMKKPASLWNESHALVGVVVWTIMTSKSPLVESVG